MIGNGRVGISPAPFRHIRTIAHLQIRQSQRKCTTDHAGTGFALRRRNIVAPSALSIPAQQDIANEDGTLIPGILEKLGAELIAIDQTGQFANPRCHNKGLRAIRGHFAVPG